MSTPTRTPFTIADSARVRNGRIVALHDAGCSALTTGRASECNCAVVYRLERTSGRGR